MSDSRKCSTCGDEYVMDYRIGHDPRSCERSLLRQRDELRASLFEQSRQREILRVENAKLRKVLRMLAKDLDGIGLDSVCKYIEAALAESEGK